MLQSRKYTIWLYTFLAFIGLSVLIILKTGSADGLAGLGTALALISGVYHSSNVYEKKVMK